MAISGNLKEFRQSMGDHHFSIRDGMIMSLIRTAAVALVSAGCVIPYAWCVLAPRKSNSPANAQTGSLPDEVVVKGEDAGRKIGTSKPPLNITTDPYESIRPSLEPDRSLFMAQSRLTVGWRHTHPDSLFSARVIEAWRNVFGERSGIT